MNDFDNTNLELISGYAFNILEADEMAKAERLLKESPASRQLLTELQQLNGNMGLLSTPQEPPAGHLARFRSKIEANPRLHAAETIEVVAGPVTFGANGKTIPATSAVPRQPEELDGYAVAATPPAEPAYTAATATNWFTKFGGLALAGLLLFSTVVFGGLWFSSQNNLNQVERQNNDLLAIIASPNLKIADLSPAGGANTSGVVRLYQNAAEGKSYILASNLPALPAGREYEAWFLNADNKATRAGLLGAGGNATNVTALANTNFNNVKMVAITVEKQGGVDQPTTSPILTAQI